MASLITVAAFTNPLEAHLAKGRLEAEGISAHVIHEHHIWANWAFSDALGGVKVQVADADIVRARDILSSHLKGEYQSALDEEFPHISENKCPTCGSKNFKSKIPAGLLIAALLTLGLVSVIFPVRREYHTCLDCGNQWRQ